MSTQQALIAQLIELRERVTHALIALLLVFFCATVAGMPFCFTHDLGAGAKIAGWHEPDFTPG